MHLKIVTLPGDGVGPEVTEQAVLVLREIANIHGHNFQFTEHDAGGTAIRRFGEPRGVISQNGSSAAFNTMRYTVSEIERVARVAFAAAMKRNRKVTSVDKANVLETSQLWRQTVSRVALEYPQVELNHLYVDAAAMHIITNPRRFDVILTENLFGDILSDEAAVIAGSLGMLSSATVGGVVDLYEPVHGSAPDIAGKGIANPLGAIASAAMLLRHTAHLDNQAAEIEAAIQEV